MKNRIKDERSKLFVSALLSLKTEDEMFSFLEDVCTIPEIKSISQRLEVAILLKKNTSYTEIAEKTGVSTATISRVKRALEYGADGYEKVLSNLEKDGKI